MLAKFVFESIFVLHLTISLSHKVRYITLEITHTEMPSGDRRPARAKRLVQLYTKAKKAGEKRLRQRKAKLRQVFRHLHSVIGPTPSLDSSTTLSDMSMDTGSYNPSAADSEGPFGKWDYLFGTGSWRGNHFLSSNTSRSVNLDLEESLPDLEPAQSDDEAYSGSGSSDSEILDADDEMSDVDSTDSDTDNIFMTDTKWSRLRKWVFTQLIEMYANRYELPRAGLPRGPSYLHHVLVCLKDSRGDHFRQQLRINPTTFDALVAFIHDDPVFMNNSNNPQMPVEEQLAITLFRFGRDGNGSGLQDVANWAGVAKGTVSLVVRRVMVAILRPGFMEKAVRFPDEEELREAKEWVEEHSCHSWKKGWCFVDGSLIPLATRPEWFGESYWDRKDRYSLNVQVLDSFVIIFLSL
jgi:hypothetical protein